MFRGLLPVRKVYLALYRFHFTTQRKGTILQRVMFCVFHFLTVTREFMLIEGGILETVAEFLNLRKRLCLTNYFSCPLA